MPNTVLSAIGRPFEHVSAWLAALYVLAVLLLGGTFAAYYLQFGNSPLSPDQSHWGQFGDFIGGILNPLLSFLSFTVLALALVLQTHQLRQADEGAARAWQAAAEAQQTLARQVRALELSLRVLAISQVMRYADNWARDLQTATPLSSADQELALKWKRRRSELSTHLDGIYSDLLGDSSSTAGQN